MPTPARAQESITSRTCASCFAARRFPLQDSCCAIGSSPIRTRCANGRAIGLETIPAPVDVIIPLMFRIDAAVMDASAARLIHQWGSGLEGVELAAARSRNIYVANVPTSGGNAESVAEHAIFLLLSLLRHATWRSRASARVFSAPRSAGCSRAIPCVSTGSAMSPWRWRGGSAPSACDCSASRALLRRRKSRHSAWMPAMRSRTASGLASDEHPDSVHAAVRGDAGHDRR